MATSFYDRPITLPAWLKRLGASPLTAVAGASLGAGALLKEGEERALKKSESNILTPWFKGVVDTAGGPGAYAKQMAPAGPAPEPIGAEGIPSPYGNFGARPSPPVVAAAPPLAPVAPAAPERRNERYLGGTSQAAGNFFGSLVGYGAELGQERRAARLSLENAKLTQDWLSKMPAAQKANLESEMLRRRLALDPNDPNSAKTAALIGGLAAPETERWGMPPNYMEQIKPGGQIPMVTNKGGAKMVTVQPVAVPATEQHIKDVLANHPEFKGDRAKAIKALKDDPFGRYNVTGLR